MEFIAERLVHKLQTLTPDQLEKVEALIESLREGGERGAGLLLSEPAFAAVWNDPENDAYDAL